MNIFVLFLTAYCGFFRSSVCFIWPAVQNPKIFSTPHIDLKINREIVAIEKLELGMFNIF